MNLCVCVCDGGGGGGCEIQNRCVNLSVNSTKLEIKIRHENAHLDACS